MSWENTIKKVNQEYTQDPKEQVLNYYAAFTELMNEILEQIKQIDFNNPDVALTEWNLLKGGLLDIEGSSIGFKEVHDNMTNALGGM
tara:strand:- start:1179 stop:1439 length:261 start_codon:yes stop_codon:yes gene_type:complete